MRDRLIELLDSKELHRDKVSLADVADYLLENGVIVPPCKITETVYLSLSETQRVTVLRC